MSNTPTLYAQAPKNSHRNHSNLVDGLINIAGGLIKLTTIFTAVATASGMLDVPDPAIALGMSAAMYVAGAGMQTMAGELPIDRANKDAAREMSRNMGCEIKPQPDNAFKRFAQNLNPFKFSI